ncbi:MAG: sensor domain-containing protein [Burkholderiales bacterium]
MEMIDEPTGTNSEGSAWRVRTEHEIAQHLEARTAGEKDTLTDRDGETVPLRVAQDPLHQRETAILNALPANIALLDARGVIISVNEAWRQFGIANVMQGPGYGIGLNYLEICDRARGDGAAEAHQAAEGIRSVLSGRMKSFSIEYPCHSPTGQRWFLLKVTPLPDNQLNGAVVMHQDVTAKRLAEESLYATDLQFRQLAETITTVFFLIEVTSNRMLYVSPAYEEIWGRSCDSLYADSGSWADAIHPDDLASTYEKHKQGMAAGKFDYETRIVRPDGSIREMAMKGFPVRDDAGKLVRIAGVAEDITERKQAQNRIVHLNRVYAVLSRINALIVRARDRDELFRETCEIAVEEGGFCMALVAMVDHQTMKIVPVASARIGEELLSAIKRLLSSSESAPRTMIARAIREKKAVVSNASQSDPQALLGKQHGESGVRSCAVLPLIVSDQAIGVIALYAHEIEFFHQEELKLLTQLASDVAFAIDHIEKAEKLKYLAYYDVLTGLANRSMFSKLLNQAISLARRDGKQLAVLFVDLDRFKNINDTLGHEAGDLLLKEVAKRLQGCLRESDTVARLGGDEFVVLLPALRDAAEVQVVARKILAATNESFVALGQEFRVTASVGASTYPKDGEDEQSLMKNADIAMYQAKEGGKNNFQFYSAQMNTHSFERLAMESRLRRALEREEFQLHYQPKIDARSGSIVGIEALLRWEHPELGTVAPMKFIPIAEETGLIVSIGKWVLKTACTQNVAWQQTGLPHLKMAVNLSRRQFSDEDLLNDITSILDETGMSPDLLELEITESTFMHDVDRAICTLKAFKDIGVRLAIDNFGTSFSSLSSLRQFPVDTIKIDGSFFRDLSTQAEDRGIAQAVIAMGKTLSLSVIAQGVETKEQVDFLRERACDEFQGFYFSKAVPADRFAELLEAQTTIGLKQRNALCDD